MTLVHDPAEYLRASELPHWYPLLEDLTPRSVWFPRPPAVAEVADRLDWPVFVKGTRQTSGHRRALSVVEGPEQFERVMAAWSGDPILRHQGVVCREYARLRLVDDSDPNRLPSAFEFRTFWWRAQLAGCGRYWWEGKSYRLTESEEADALALAREAARRVNVPFLVLDIAQTVDGRWLVIECNDGQESGYGGVSPLALWQRIIDLERQAIPRG
jgi:ATP-grasp domain, R2K clade family 3